MKSRDLKLTELEKLLMIKFNNIKFLDTALTHSSFANQKIQVDYNERMEFLGDSVLQLTISEYLFNNYKDKLEGELTKLRSLIVCENSLYEIAKVWNLGEFINMSRGEELTGGRWRVSILADAVEAIIAAIYLDQGFNSVSKFILRNFKDTICKACTNEIILDYKTKLQETLQKNGEIDIQYNMIGFDGPPHRRIFYMEVIIDGISKGKGEGYSKKEAEQNAAKNSLKVLED
jgi:ribonuclease III